MADDAMREKWNTKYLQQGPSQWPVAEVLLENKHLLPEQGSALDLACGYGANARLLAEHGLQTYAWDISNVAIEHIATPLGPTIQLGGGHFAKTLLCQLEESTHLS